MKIKKLRLKDFKRFTNLTIDLGNHPRKIIALVGPNGCGKSGIFDAFEEQIKVIKGGHTDQGYLHKLPYVEGQLTPYDRKNSILIEKDNEKPFDATSFYLRSAYRFTSKLNLETIKKLPDIKQDHNRPMTASDLDVRMQENYERLLGGFFNDVFDKDITGKQWCDKNIEKLNNILSIVLDIKISNLGNPVDGKGKLYFSKGRSKNFPYDNLSAGEKEVVDLVLDFIVKKDIFCETIICIDEPELHLNTMIQRKLLIEIEKLIPDNCQLWVATHSIGFLRALQEDLKDKTHIIDMSDHDFDNEIILNPMITSRKNWQKVFKTALEDITGLVAPKTIVYCEGKILNSLDEQIFNQIFSDYFDALFVSATNKSEAIKYAGVALTIINKAFNDVEIKVVVDRDEDESQLTLPKGSNVKICSLARREFENYLFDYEIILKAFPSVSRENYEEIISDIVNDDVKSKISQIKSICGEPSESRLKLRLAEMITLDTNVYHELKKIIFGDQTIEEKYNHCEQLLVETNL